MTFKANALQAVAEATMRNGKLKWFREMSEKANATGNETIGYARELQRAQAVIDRLYAMGFRVVKRRRNKEVD
jgi:hypothetical protein